MVDRLLVTTALEDTWPDKDVPVLFLGEWCRLYDKESAWKNRDAQVAEYHWDDRSKLYRDYEYLRDLYEILLAELATQLNRIHGEERSVRYWRIIVGPWLGFFLQILFDRWAMLDTVAKEADLLGVRTMTYDQASLVPNDMTAFIPMILSDQWNDALYGQVLQHMDFPAEIVQLGRVAKPDYATGFSVNARTAFKRKLAKMLSSITGVFSRDREYFFISSYLGLKNELLLQLKLGQIPKLWRAFTVPVAPFNETAREWTLPGNSDKPFEDIARKLIPQYLPVAYLEGYGRVLEQVQHLPWPRHPKTVFTSVSHNADDVFKAWAADCAEKGIPIVIGQHGGTYGTSLWNFTEDHQLAICDRFLSWGWSYPGADSIVPVGNFKTFGKSVKRHAPDTALLIQTVVPQQSYHLYSVPAAAGQWCSYFNDQCRFVHALQNRLHKVLSVRLYPQDFRYCQKQRWHDAFPDVQVDDGSVPMQSVLERTRICISTYNATTYLESMSLNIPTIMYWNPEHWELNDHARPFFDRLEAIGIFHRTPESAAEQLNRVWDDVDSWWESTEVRAVRDEFCSQYTRMPDRPLDVLTTLFRDIAGNDRKGNGDVHPVTPN